MSSLNFLTISRRTVAVFGMLLGLACGGAAFAQEKLRIATEGTYPPWSFVDAQGKLQGWDVDIANALCARMNMQCEIMAQDWDGIIPSLLAKKYDAIVASMAMTPARLERVAFSDKSALSSCCTRHSKSFVRSFFNECKQKIYRSRAYSTINGMAHQKAEHCSRPN